MDKYQNVIAVKIFFPETKPLFCKLVLQKVARRVYKDTQEASWRVVLYQQWVGDPEPVLAGLSYIQEAQATDRPDPQDVTLIEIICNQRCSPFSQPAVEAARAQLVDMFSDSPILINYLSPCNATSRL